MLSISSTCWTKHTLQSTINTADIFLRAWRSFSVWEWPSFRWIRLNSSSSTWRECYRYITTTPTWLVIITVAALVQNMQNPQGKNLHHSQIIGACPPPSYTSVHADVWCSASEVRVRHAGCRVVPEELVSRHSSCFVSSLHSSTFRRSSHTSSTVGRIRSSRPLIKLNTMPRRWKSKQRSQLIVTHPSLL